MKNAFSLIELIFIIFLLSILAIFPLQKYDDHNLKKAANRIILYLKEARLQSLIDNKKEKETKLWYKQRWTLKFFRCRKEVGGIYYTIYSDKNMKGHVNLEETLSDPLTNKKIYSSNKCEESLKTSKYVLLTKEFGINEVEISCNRTNSIGQISFGKDGRIYSRLSNYEREEDEYEIKDRCKIRLISEGKGEEGIIVEAKTGYVYKE